MEAQKDRFWKLPQKIWFSPLKVAIAIMVMLIANLVVLIAIPLTLAGSVNSGIQITLTLYALRVFTHLVPRFRPRKIEWGGQSFGSNL